jgi:hypothetical protein
LAETFVADSWLYAVLTGDATLMGLAAGGVHGYNNPNRSPLFPYVLFQMQGAGQDVRGVGTARIMAPMVYVVRGISEGNSFGGSLRQIADRIDTLLHAASGTAAGGLVLVCVREQPFALPETAPDGRQYRHLGGIYRLFVQD